MALTSKLSAIGDAIRSKTGTSDLMTLDEMPTAIESIETGGEVDTTIEDALISGIGLSGDYENDRVTEIADYSFRFNSGNETLTSVSFPNVVTIGEFSFYACMIMTDVSFPSAKYVEESCFSSCMALTNVCFPSAATVEAYAFRNCQSLAKVDLPVAERITYTAFENCGALEALILRSATMTELWGTSASGTTIPFKGSLIETSSDSGYIYVPSALVEEYKAADNWAKHSDKIRAIEDYPDICGEA